MFVTRILWMAFCAASHIHSTQCLNHGTEDTDDHVVRKRPLVKVTAREFLPMVGLVKEDDGNFRVEGIMGEVIRALAKSLKIDYQVVKPPDDKNGAPMGNGSWNGMIGMILRGDAEFALGPLSYSLSRASAIAYPTPLHYDHIALMVMKPRITSDPGAFLKPFTPEVWISIFISMVLITFALVAIEKCEGKLYKSRTTDVTSKALMWSMKALTQEGSEWLPSKDGGRVLVATWLLSSLVIMSLYSGTLTAKLTVPRADIPIDSLEDLVNQTEIPWRLAPGSNEANYFKESDYEVHQKVYKGSSGSFSSCWGSKESVAVGEFALICVGIEILQIMSWDFSTTGSCRIYKARENVFNNDMSSMVFKKNSKYLAKARKLIIQLHESGLYNHWRWSSLVNVTQCAKSPSAQRSSEGVSALDLEAFGGSFLLLIAGYVMSFTMFLSEKIYSKNKPRSEDFGLGLY